MDLYLQPQPGYLHISTYKYNKTSRLEFHPWYSFSLLKADQLVIEVQKCGNITKGYGR